MLQYHLRPSKYALESQFFIPKIVIKNTYITADDTSLGALQPSKASPHTPRHWNISMGILIVQASVIDDNIDTKIQDINYIKYILGSNEKRTFYHGLTINYPW